MRKITTPMIAALVLSFLLVSGLHSADVQDDFLVILFDASGSMNEFMTDAYGHFKLDKAGNKIVKIDAAKKAFKEALKGVPPTTNVALRVFSSSQGTDWFYPLGPCDAAKLTRIIDSITPKGDTPLAMNIIESVNLLCSERDRRNNVGRYRLLILTDGNETVNETLLERIVSELEGSSRKIQVDVIGVNMKSEHALAKRMHSYVNADDLESLQSAVKSKVVLEMAKPDVNAGTVDDLEGFPPDVAVALINAFCERPDNSPISARDLLQRPRRTVAPRVVAQSPAPAAVQQSQPPAAKQNDTQQNAQPAQAHGGAAKILVWFIIIVVVVISISIIGSVLR